MLSHDTVQPNVAAFAAVKSSANVTRYLPCADGANESMLVSAALSLFAKVTALTTLTPYPAVATPSYCVIFLPESKIKFWASSSEVLLIVATAEPEAAICHPVVPDTWFVAGAAP